MIETKDLCVRFADGTGIRYADQRFEAGRSYALLGASGCGKSTFLNLLAGILTPSEGVVEIDGFRITGVMAGTNTTLSAEWEGEVYSCIIRVRKQTASIPGIILPY